jgi:hypothetical protein
LNHRDLEVLAIEPMVKSDGQMVQKELEETAAKVGAPRAIVSDHGADIKRGIEGFQVDHQETVSLYDIAHKTAILVKRELEADGDWSEYLKHIGRAKQCLQQTPLASLTPPTPCNKARYMNLEKMIAWGMNALKYLAHPRPLDDKPIDREQLRKKLGWLSEYRRALARWDAMMRVVAATLQYIRQEGYHRRAAATLQRRLKPLATNRQSQRLAGALVDFVREQSAHARRNEHLIGSSECIESLIGKGKRLEGQQSKSGFTRMILAMAAAVVTPTKAYIDQAFAHVKTHDVTQWCREKLGVSVQSQRRRALAYSGCGTKPG